MMRGNKFSFTGKGVYFYVVVLGICINCFWLGLRSGLCQICKFVHFLGVEGNFVSYFVVKNLKHKIYVINKRFDESFFFES